MNPDVKNDVDLGDAFGRLLGREATAEERANLLRVRDVLGLRSNDALWLVLLALESYDARFRAYPQRIREELDAGAKGLQAAVETAAQEVLDGARRPGQHAAGPSARPWRAVLAAVAGLVVFGSICLVAGFNLGRGTAPSWLAALPATSSANRVAGAVLRAPAGWMAFLLVLPLLWAGVRTGWRSIAGRARGPLERASGAALLAGCACALVAAVVVLAGLL